MAQPKAIAPDESNLIRVMLSARNAPKQIKRGLQRLCGHLEHHRRIPESEDLRQLTRSLLWDGDPVVRMYAFKVLGLFARPEDAEVVVARLKQEQDFETQTWGMAALIGIAGDRELTQVFKDTGLETSLPLLLAGQLYASPKWTTDNYRPLLVPENSDRITMKWAVLLVAYRKAPPNLFSPRHDNRILLGELNKHDVDEIAEHSTWALFEHPDYGPSDYTVDLHQIPKLPADVKKWAFRLLMTAPERSGIDCDALAQFRRDSDLAAREGLALGLDCFNPDGASRVVLEWFEAEREESVREILLEHMAAKSAMPEYAATVVEAFRSAALGGPTRGRLLAAARGAPVYKELQRRVALEAMADAGMSRDLLGGDFIMGSKITVEGGNSGFLAGGDQNAQNMVVGDMIRSANGAVQNLSNERQGQKELLEAILSVLKGNTGFREGSADAVAGAVSEVAKDPTQKNKMSLFGALKGLVSGAGLAADLVKHVDKLADAVMDLF